MPTSVAHTVKLARHPASCGTAVRAIEARASRKAGGMLALAYAIEGDVSRLNVPPPRPPRFAGGLWRHTCCECFIALAGKTGYHEFNFAPSGVWAAYTFAKYREGTPLEDETLNPRIAVHRGTDRLDLEAAIPLGRLPAEYARSRLVLGLSAVVEDDDGALSYWALAHAPGQPDFHHPDAFALEL